MMQCVTHSKHGVERRVGHNRDHKSPILYVATGLSADLDPRCVSPGHRLYSRLKFALREQDAWTVSAHTAFWTAILPELPLPSRPSKAPLLSRAAAALRADGMTPGEIAAVLNVDQRTVREVATRGMNRRGDDVARTRRKRPSYELGAELIAAAVAGDHGQAMLRSTDTGFLPWDALPRVFEEDVDDEVRWFNTRIEFAWDPPGFEYADAAVGELRLRWARRASS